MTEKKVVGECTPGCGACCRVLAIQDPVANGLKWPNSMLDQGLLPLFNKNTPPQFLYFFGIRGLRVAGQAIKVPINLLARRSWWRAPYNKRPMIYFSSVCPQLDETGLCKLHGTDSFPQVCSEFPMVGDDLGMLPTCTYEIVEVVEGDAPTDEELSADHGTDNVSERTDSSGAPGACVDSVREVS